MLLVTVPGHAGGAPVPADLHVAGHRAGEDEVSCDWWRAGHVTPVLTSDWSRVAEQLEAAVTTLEEENTKLREAGASDRRRIQM